jgi:hypothetical protein
LPSAVTLSAGPRAAVLSVLAFAAPRPAGGFYETGRYAGDAATLAAIAGVLKRAGVEFIDENGGDPGVRLRKRQLKKG